MHEYIVKTTENRIQLFCPFWENCLSLDTRSLLAPFIIGGLKLLVILLLEVAGGSTVCHNCVSSLVVLHYIGAGKRGADKRVTGDWCFEDGFVTFRDLAHLYLQLLRGHVLTIVTDCSHSGSWVRECMTFLDEQGVGPCGHSARDKGILIKVAASCLSHEIPRQLAFSVHNSKNDKSTGFFSFTNLRKGIRLGSKIDEGQHVRGIDFTEVLCGCDFIAEECLCLPQATWQTWGVRKRIKKVRATDRGRKAWRVVLLLDNDETVIRFIEKTQGEESGKHTVNLKDYGEVLESGWGEDVPQDIVKSVLQQKFPLYRENHSTGQWLNSYMVMVSYIYNTVHLGTTGLPGCLL